MNCNALFESAELKYLNRLALTECELQLMETLLQSSESRIRSIACGALLRDSQSSGEQKAKAFGCLKRLCETKSATEDSIEISFTIILMPEEYLSDKAIRGFAYGLLSSQHFTRRANGLCILERLVRVGDSIAMKILRTAIFDPDERLAASAIEKVNRLKGVSS